MFCNSAFENGNLDLWRYINVLLLHKKAFKFAILRKLPRILSLDLLL